MSKLIHFPIRNLPIIVVLTLICGSMQAQVTWTSSQADNFAVTGPLSSLPAAQVISSTHTDPFEAEPSQNATANNGAQDTALQSTHISMPTVADLATFSGIGLGTTGFSELFIPSDVNGAVGNTQYVQWVNTSFAVFRKSDHAIVLGPLTGNTLFQSLGDHPCAHNNDGDPIAQYDKLNNRWILMQLSHSNNSTQGFWQCVAVSQSSDATGMYNVYAFRYTDGFNDYPKLGIWNNAYFATYSMQSSDQPSAVPLGAKICAWDSAAMRAGSANVTQVCAQMSSSVNVVLPADLDGSLSPPAGSPAIFASLSPADPAIYIWQLSGLSFGPVPGATLTGPIMLPIAPLGACGSAHCVQQRDPSGLFQNWLEPLQDRLMYRLAYRNFGDHQAVVVNHSVVAAPGSTLVAGTEGVRWYEIRDPGGSPFIYQQGTYSPDSTSRFYASTAMDHNGNIAVGYSVVSPTVDPGVRITGRAPGDPLNLLGDELSVQGGTGIQVGGQRWGDYSSMSIDPVDDCTFYYTDQFILSPDGVRNWRTVITSFRFNGCGTPTAATPVFTPPAGTYSSASPQSVTITDSTSGATIHYTLDGSTPTATSPVFSSALSISTPTTIKAIATASGFNDSAVASATYNFLVPAPVISPVAGNYSSPQTVTITDADPAATIYYTVDGSTPTTSSPIYTGTFIVNSTTTVKAIAARSGFIPSPVTSVLYNFPGMAATPVFNPAPGTYIGSVTVAITDSTSGAVIHYTLDGSTPTAASLVYSAPITISTTLTLKAFATASGFMDSLVNSGTYTIQAPPPTFTPAAGTYNPPVSATLSDSVSGASIRYTLDGSTPTAASPLYAGPISLTTTTTIKAIAIAGGMNNSTVASALYTMQAATPTFTPSPGAYGSNQSVSIADTTSGVTIRYTVDGSTPTASSTLYSGPISVINTTTIKAIAIAPAGVTNSAVATGTYTINHGPPTITAINPTTGTIAGGTAITIIGTNFVSGATVKLGSNFATGVNVVSSTQINAVSPAGPVGTVNLVVINPDGQSAALVNAYTYFQPLVFTSWAKPSSASWGPPNTLTTGGTAFRGNGTVQLVWRDVTLNGAWNTVATQATPDGSGNWWNTVPSSNYCHTFTMYANYLGVSSDPFTYVGIGSAYCNETAYISWIQPQGSAGFGPPGSLVLAGNATGAPAGSGVVVWWSDITAGTGWNMGATTFPDASGFWTNSIPNVNYSHQYSVYVVYDAFSTQASQGVCTYAGNGSITYCPR